MPTRGQVIRASDIVTPNEASTIPGLLTISNTKMVIGSGVGNTPAASITSDLDHYLEMRSAGTTYPEKLGIVMHHEGVSTSALVHVNTDANTSYWDFVTDDSGTNEVRVSGKKVWHAGNFDPNTKLNLSGGTLTGAVDASVIYNDDSGISIPFVKGGRLSTSTSSYTGYMKITLPVSWTSTMMQFLVDVYDYQTGESFTLYIGGYNYSSGSWMNTSAYIIGSNMNRNFTVRFGHDGSKCAIYIGESNSVWEYPQINVRDFFGGFSGANTQWNGSWAVGFTTTLGTVSSTITNTLTVASNADTVDGYHASDFAPSGFGLGTAAELKSDTDWNTVKTTGFYRMNGSGANRPPAVSGENTGPWHYLIVTRHDDAWVSQLAIEYSTGIMFRRVLVSNGWKAWDRIVDQTFMETQSVQKAGDNMTAALTFPSTATGGMTAATPTALSYGKLQAYGNLLILGDTDNSSPSGEYVLIASSRGISPTTAQGLRVGQTTLTWLDNTVWHAGNFTPSEKANGETFTASVKGVTWSRILQLSGTTTVGHSLILNIRGTRSSTVFNVTFQINTSHSSQGNIVQLGNTTYSNITVRTVVDTNGNGYIELYDDATGITNATTQSLTVTYLNLSGSTMTPITTFTDGTTLPASHSAKGQIKSVSGASIVGDVSGNSSTASKLETSRTITLSGDVTGSVSFDGSSNVSITTTVGNDSHEHTRVDAADDRDVKPVDTSKGFMRPYFTTYEGLTGAAGTNYHDLLVLNTYSDSSAGNVNALAFDKDAMSIKHFQAAQDATTWGTAKVLAYTDSNVATATKLATARTITLGGDLSGSASFDGSANITITATVADDSHNHTIANVDGLQTTLDGIMVKSSATLPATAGWYRIAQSASGIGRCAGRFEVEWAISGNHGHVIFNAGILYGDSTTANMTQTGFSNYGAGGLTKARIVYHTTYSGNYAYLELYNSTASAVAVNVQGLSLLGWSLVTPSTAGSIPSGYSNRELSFIDGISTEGSVRTGTVTGVNYIYGTSGTIAKSTDEWLRINEDASHTSGTYFGSTIVRTDGEFQVDGSGASFKANSSGVVIANTITLAKSSSDTSLKVSNSSGYIEIAPKNTSYAHIYTDRPSFYFNKELHVNGNKVWHAGNDGSGTGLDADTVDGFHATALMNDKGADTADWNTITEMGVYRVGRTDWTGTSNTPTSAYAYGTLVVTTSGTSTTQTFYPHNSAGGSDAKSPWTRTKWNASDWGVWAKIWTSMGFDPSSKLDSTANAVSASKLATARTISLTGDVTGSVSFDGSGNVSIATTYKNSGVTAGTYKSVTVDAKGNITAGTNPTTLSGYGITDAATSSQLGTLTSLSTTNKSNIVAAINELFQSASDGKNLIATAITGKGVDASSSDTWQTLASKIDEISDMSNQPLRVITPGSTSTRVFIGPEFPPSNITVNENDIFVKL